jgi:hypothetical protein
MTPEESNPTRPRMPWSAYLDRLSERQMVGLVILCGLLLYLPFAGAYGLWDPWETHYGEVAREMTVRGDYISLYWAGSPIDPEVFWSKPVLSFWLISLSLHIFGLAHPSPETFALSTRPEWALRWPCGGCTWRSLASSIGVRDSCRCWPWRPSPCSAWSLARP